MTLRSLRLLLLLVPVLPVLTGCSQFRVEAGKFIDHLQTLQQQKEQHQAASKPRPAQKPPKAETPPAKLANIHQITKMLDDGKFEEARHQLTFYVRKHPDDEAAKSFLHQVSVDPKEELGPPAHKYKVKPGDTLGGIAAHYLGNPMQFVILARYNDIKRSRDLRVGQSLSIPATSRKGSKPETSKTSAAPAKNPAHAETSSDTKSTPPAADNSASSAPGLTDTQRQQARALQAAGLEKLRAHKQEDAYHDLKQALAINPDLEPAKMTADRLQTQLVRKYHEQALAAYRDQKLKKAIALWDKALAIDPNYEPAQGYRARALELQRRLQQLDKKN